MIRVRRGDRLVDHDLPGLRTDEDGEEVQEDRDGDPVPVDELEGVAHEAQIGPAPDDERDDRGQKRQDDGEAAPAGVRNHAAIVERAGAPTRPS